MKPLPLVTEISEKISSKFGSMVPYKETLRPNLRFYPLKQIGSGISSAWLRDFENKSLFKTQ